MTRKFHNLQIGQIILVLDALIILLSAIVYQDIDSGLYACIMIFTATTIIDRVLTSGATGKLIFIISRVPHKVSHGILTELKRGCTFLEAKGGFTQTPRQVLLCVVRRNELWRVKRLVKERDPQAFMTVADAGQVLGEGFMNLSQE